MSKNDHQERAPGDKVDNIMKASLSVGLGFLLRPNLNPPTNAQGRQIKREESTICREQWNLSEYPNRLAACARPLYSRSQILVLKPQHQASKRIRLARNAREAGHNDDGC